MSKDEFLTKNVQGAYNLQSLTGDAGTRSYSRVNTSSKSYILCAYKSNELEHLSNYLDIQELLLKQNVNVPQTSAQDKNLMLLEDLGDTTLESIFKTNHAESKLLYTKTIDEMVKIHNLSLKGNSKAQSYSFNVEKFEWELNFALEHLRRLLSLKEGPHLSKALKQEFHELSKTLCAFPQVVTHRDFHSRNIMIHNQKPYVIDFQDARLGPLFYDLVSLLEDSYVDMPQNMKSNLIKYYCTKRNIDLTSDFTKNYHIQNIQRSLKACGSFASLKNLKNTQNSQKNEKN